MADPKTLGSAIAELFRKRGIDIADLPVPEGEDPDPFGDREHARLAVAYFEEHTPARYRDAVADEPGVVEWVRRLVEESVPSANGRTVRKGPSMFLLGRTGVGKTHQAYGAFRLLAERGVRARWVPVSAADLYARLRPRHGVDSEAEFRAVADAPLLLVDDLGAAKTSEWVEEINYRLVNWRYERELPTLFTSNVPPKELSPVLGERVASRLSEMATRVAMKGDDRRRVTA